MPRKRTERNKLVGKNIQYLIDADPNMNKSKLASLLGVDVKSVRRWTNEGVFPAEYITDIADKLHVSIDHLLNIDMTFGVSQEGKEHWDTLRNNIDAANRIEETRRAFIQYLRAIGVTVDFKRNYIEGTELRKPLPDQVLLQWDGKEMTIPYSEYEQLRDGFSRSITNKLNRALNNK